jgi:hypothetical protein
MRTFEVVEIFDHGRIHGALCMYMEKDSADRQQKLQVEQMCFHFASPALWCSCSSEGLMS